MPQALKKKKEINGVLLSFIIALITATVFFLPFVILDKGFFTYSGDFNSQQIPFYVYVQNFVKTQPGTWSWATDLGGSIINSYSFYNIGSPFLWLATLFPNSWMPYMMAPLLILKFACIAAFACLYLQRYAKTRNMAVIASLLYAFCGFNVYNIFFNHMHEAVVLFPLMLWAMDEFFYNKRRGVFAVFVALALINNYFFFIGNVVFLIIYFIVKSVYGEYKLSGKKFLLIALEAVLGVGMAMLIALPSFLSLIQNPRVDSFSNGFGLVMYGRVQQYFAIFSSAFFPPESPYHPNLFTEGAIKWTSMSAFLPFVSMAGVIAYFKARKKNSVKTVIIICMVMACFPILNSAFYAFNSSYYARWYYMPLLMMCLATMKSLEEEDIDLEKGAKISMIIIGLFAIFGILPKKVDDSWTIGLAEYQSLFWYNIISSFVSVLILYVIVRFYREKANYSRKILAGVLGFTVIYSVVHIGICKLPQLERDSRYKEFMYDTLMDMELPDDGFYRIDAYEMEYDNVGLWMDESCLQTFNSVVTPSILEFYPLAGVKRDVSSKPEHEMYYLRGLLSVRYLIVPEGKVEEFEEKDFSKGWSVYKTQGPVTVYENENFVPLGFCYDDYMSMEKYEEANKTTRERALLRALILTDEQIEKYGHLFIDKIETPDSFKNYERYTALCDSRRETASYEVTADSTGFTSKIVLDRDNLVFYAVPYDKGFSVTVNGEQAELIKVSGGLIAVEAKTGDNEIVFSYETPGFKEGMKLSMASLIALLIYLVLCVFWRRKDFIFRKAEKPLIESRQNEEHKA